MLPLQMKKTFGAEWKPTQRCVFLPHTNKIQNEMLSPHQGSERYCHSKAELPQFWCHKAQHTSGPGVNDKQTLGSEITWFDTVRTCVLACAVEFGDGTWSAWLNNLFKWDLFKWDLHWGLSHLFEMLYPRCDALSQELLCCIVEELFGSLNRGLK
jgi:hypothetical protein